MNKKDYARINLFIRKDQYDWLRNISFNLKMSQSELMRKILDNQIPVTKKKEE